MLTVDEARQLDSLGISARESAPGSGTHIARMRGAGLEFHDFRRYRPGDAVRAIDWTIYARLRQLVVREFRADAHVRVHLLLDRSRSMVLGAPPKLACAKKLAALLCYVASTGGDAIALASFDETIGSHVALAHGAAQAGKVFASIAAVTPGGRSDLTGALMAYGSLAHGPGMAIVISDFFDEHATDGLRFLVHRGLTPCVVQVIAPEELDPPNGDAIELVDAEFPDGHHVVVGRHATIAYRRQIRHELQMLTDFCIEHGMPRLLVTSSMSFADLIHQAASAGLLATRK